MIPLPHRRTNQRPRCPVAIEKCSAHEPPLEELKPGHWVARWVAREQVRPTATSGSS